MRKIACMVLLLMIVAPVSFAQETSNRPSQVVLESKAFEGTVDELRVRAPLEGTRFEIVVVSKKGQKIDFVVPSGIAVMTRDGRMIPPKRLKKGDKVVIEYTTTKQGGLNRVMSITVEP